MVSSGIRVSCRCYFCCFYYNPQIRDCQVANQNIRDIFDLNPLIRDRQEHIMIFNERLKTLLAERDVSWKQVSQELSIGKTQPKYWADNDTLPDGKTLVKLSHFSVFPLIIFSETKKEALLLVSIATSQNKKKPSSLSTGLQAKRLS